MLDKVKKELREGKTFLQFGFLRGVGQGLGMVAPLVVAKFFEPDLFGSYSLAKMIVFFFATLLINSLQMAFVVFANQEKTKSHKINKTFSAQCLFFLLSCVLFVGAVGIFNRQLTSFAKITSDDLWFLLLAFLGLGIKSFLCNLFMAMNERIKNSLAELVYGFFSVALVFFFHLLWGLNLRIVLSIYPVAAVFLLVFFIPTINFHLLLPFRIEISYVREMFSFTKWQLMGLTAVYFINWGDNLVLRYYDVYMGDIGVYNLAYQFFKGILALTAITTSYFLPFVSQNIRNPEKMRGYLYKKRPRILLAGTVVIVLVFLVLPYALSTVYGESYKQSAVIFRILIIAAVMTLYNTFYYTIFYSMRKSSVIQSISVIQVLLNLILNFVLIPMIGILGAAVATVIAYFFRGIITELYFRLKLRKALNL